MTAQQPFRLLKKFGDVELRHYPDYVLMQVEAEGDFMRAGSAAFGPLIAGAWWLNVPLLRAGAWLLAVGVGLFLTGMIGVLNHLWRPATGTPAAAAKNFPP